MSDPEPGQAVAAGERQAQGRRTPESTAGPAERPARRGAKDSARRRATRRSSARRSTPREPAAELPVARVVIDLPLAHLDRPFDYLVPADAADVAVPGSRVRVRFAGQLVDGMVLDRVAVSEHTGRLAFLDRAVSAESVLAPEIARLARAVADRHAGTLADVLRLAVPPRHAGAEGAPSPDPLPAPPAPDAGGWAAYAVGTGFLTALGDARAARAVWQALPGEHAGSWPARIAEAVQATLAAGRGAVVVVPDARDLERVDAATTAALGQGRHVALTAGLGPQERYRRWLAVRRGAVRAVVGTRAAAFAPVADLGLAVLWDDGDDLHAEPRAPYCHARDVLLNRVALAGSALLIGGFARTAEAQLLVETGWAQPLVAPRATVRALAPRVTPTGEDHQLARDPGARSARLPSVAWSAARESLTAGAPVLVQVPRRGYVPALACGACRAPARCPTCSGPLAQPSGRAGAVPMCRWCGRPAADWHCPACDSARLRAVVVGSQRTAEEIGRAFPGVRVLSSAGPSVLGSLPARPAVVVATPGAEPVADGGYGAALLLDAWALLTRPDLRAAEETLRRWYAAAALVRPGDAGGRVIVTADAGLPPVQALVRWDPAWHAARELHDRRELGFPPAARFASLAGSSEAIGSALDGVSLPEGGEVLGPVPLDDDRERLLIRVPMQAGGALATALSALQRARSARKTPEPLRVEIDPLELL